MHFQVRFHVGVVLHDRGLRRLHLVERSLRAVRELARRDRIVAGRIGLHRESTDQDDGGQKLMLHESNPQVSIFSEGQS